MLALNTLRKLRQLPDSKKLKLNSIVFVYRPEISDVNLYGARLIRRVGNKFKVTLTDDENTTCWRVQEDGGRVEVHSFAWGMTYCLQRYQPSDDEIVRATHKMCVLKAILDMDMEIDIHKVMIIFEHVLVEWMDEDRRDTVNYVVPDHIPWMLHGDTFSDNNMAPAIAASSASNSAPNDNGSLQNASEETVATPAHVSHASEAIEHVHLADQRESSEPRAVQTLQSSADALAPFPSVSTTTPAGARMARRSSMLASGRCSCGRAPAGRSRRQGGRGYEPPGKSAEFPLYRGGFI